MYVTRVEIENIRSIKHLVWEIDAGDAPGWHVILGDNGSGKSTVLRSIGLALVGPPQILALRQDFNKWLTQGENRGSVSLRLVLDRDLDQPRPSHRSPVALTVKIARASSSKVTKDPDDLPLHDQTSSGWFSASYGPLRRFTGGDQEEESLMQSTPRLARHLSAFSESVALTEGLRWLQELRFQTLEAQNRVKSTNPATFDRAMMRRELTSRLSRSEVAVIWFDTFGTILDDDIPGLNLSEVVIQLISRASQSGHLVNLIESIRLSRPDVFPDTDNSKDSSVALLSNLKDFINQPEFLPHRTQLQEVTSDGVRFVDGNGSPVLIEELSDGYRSILSMTFELLRQLNVAYSSDLFQRHGDGKVMVKVPGIVQIDEIDAHLHPTWQRRIGTWFREYFPNIQFIVTTHSPLICQAAEKGTIFQLPQPGTDEVGRFLEGAERDRLIYGNILEAYSTEAFGAGITRSETSQKMLDRLAALNIQELDEGLTDEETKEQEHLRSILPTTATSRRRAGHR